MFLIVFFSILVLTSAWTVYAYIRSLRRSAQNGKRPHVFASSARVFGVASLRERLEFIWEGIKRAFVSLILPTLFSAHVLIIVVDHVVDEALIVPDYFLRVLLVGSPDIVRFVIIGAMILFAIGNVLFSFFVVTDAFSRFVVRLKGNKLILQNGKRTVATFDPTKPFEYDLREYSTGSMWKSQFVAVHETILFKQNGELTAISFPDISRMAIAPGFSMNASPFLQDVPHTLGAPHFVVYQPFDIKDTLRKRALKWIEQPHATRAEN